MSDLDNMPDFDNMSPEELQLWMESLAKRQGANEGLITSADMDVPEIDPDSVTIDEPGYVPSESFTSSSMKSKTGAAPKVEIEPEPVAEVEAELEDEPESEDESEPVKPVEPPAATPAIGTPGRGTGERVRLPTQPPPPAPKIEQLAASVSIPDESILPAAELQPEMEPASGIADMGDTGVSGGALAWLESLAANQGEGDFELDLSSLAGETFEDDEVVAERGAVNPESWLDSLVISGGELDEEVEAERPSARVSGAFIESQPSWMDELSRDDDEDDIELPDLAAVGADDPQDWLSSLSASEGYDEEGVGALRQRDTLDQLDETEDERYETPAVDVTPEMSTGLSGIEVDQETLDEIKKAIAEGRVSSDQMQLLLDYQTDIMAQESSTEIELDDFYDPDAPPEKGEIPDWLLASAGNPPDLDAIANEPSTSALEDALENAPPVPAEMPDWLKDDLSIDQPVDFQSIFAEDDEESDFVVTAAQEGEDELEMESALEFEIDESDSWGEAFELERNQGLGDLESPPEWYERNLSDPDRIAAVEEIERTRLTQSMLPAEQDLQAAEQVDVPEWLQDVAAQQGEISTDMPEWLREAEQATASDAIVSEEIPDWLVEVVGGYEEPASTPIETPAAAPEPVMVVTPPQPKREAAPPPPPRPAPEVHADVAAALQQARELAQGEDVGSGLLVYESLIRANVALEDVVNDLQSLKRQPEHRANPAVYRVLGDGLMRQGNLQAALDTYRDALNQL